jgi:ribosomal protein L30/L7E
MIIVVRIAGQVKNKKKDNETLSRLKLRKKFASTLIDSKDKVRMGMVEAVSHMVSYGEVPEDFVKTLKAKRKGNTENVFHGHPPVGGFKKSSKVAFPKGILGNNRDILKLVERML